MSEYRRVTTHLEKVYMRHLQNTSRAQVVSEKSPEIETPAHTQNSSVPQSSSADNTQEFITAPRISWRQRNNVVVSAEANVSKAKNTQSTQAEVKVSKVKTTQSKEAEENANALRKLDLQRLVAQAPIFFPKPTPVPEVSKVRKRVDRRNSRNYKRTKIDNNDGEKENNENDNNRTNSGERVEFGENNSNNKRKEVSENVNNNGREEVGENANNNEREEVGEYINNDGREEVGEYFSTNEREEIGEYFSNNEREEISENANNNENNEGNNNKSNDDALANNDDNINKKNDDNSNYSIDLSVSFHCETELDNFSGLLISKSEIPTMYTSQFRHNLNIRLLKDIEKSKEIERSKDEERSKNIEKSKDLESYKDIERFKRVCQELRLKLELSDSHIRDISKRFDSRFELLEKANASIHNELLESGRLREQASLELSECKSKVDDLKNNVEQLVDTLKKKDKKEAEQQSAKSSVLDERPSSGFSEPESIPWRRKKKASKPVKLTRTVWSLDRHE